jgi:hypothetical protein
MSYGVDSYANTVLYQCALQRDISLFEAGDRTEVGEKGLTLRLVNILTGLHLDLLIFHISVEVKKQGLLLHEPFTLPRTFCYWTMSVARVPCNVIADLCDSGIGSP